MRDAVSPRVHLFVCTNRRDDAGLGPGCGARGDALYDAFKEAVRLHGWIADVWVTRTKCLGVCPKKGATVARYPHAHPIVADVLPEDAGALLEDARNEVETQTPPSWSAIDRELEALRTLHTDKVLDLARRLKPGLTLEDIQNPHDFPELADPDWHHADGILVGIETTASALRALRKAGGSP